MKSDKHKPKNPAGNHIALVGSSSSPPYIEEMRNILAKSLKKTPVINVSLEDAILHRKLSGVGIVVLFLSHSDINDDVLKWIETPAEWRIFPVWCSNGDEIPGTWKHIPFVIRPSLDIDQLKQGIVTDILTVVREQREKGEARDAFHTKNEIPALYIGGKPSFLIFNEPRWISIGLALLYGTILFPLYRHLEFINSPTLEGKRAAISVGGTGSLFLYIVAILSAVGLIHRLYRLCFPRMAVIITGEYFYFRGKKKFNLQWKWKKRWRRVPLGLISHFSAASVEQFGLWGPGKLTMHRFSSYDDSEYRKEENIELPFFLDELMIARVLNGQLRQYRSYINPFKVCGSFEPSKEGRQRFRAAFVNLRNLVVIGFEIFKENVVKYIGAIKEGFCKIVNSGWGEKVLQFLGVILSMGVLAIFLIIWLGSFMFGIHLLKLIVFDWTGLAIDFVINLLSEPSLAESIFFILILLLTGAAFIRNRVYNLEERAQKKTGAPLDHIDHIHSDKAGLLLSYSHNDSVVIDLAELLRRNGVTVWIDRFKVYPDEDWLEKVGEGLTDHEVLGIVISEKSVNSRWVQKEVKLALEKKGDELKILPILIDDVPVPDFLLRYGYVDLRNEENYHDGFNEILFRLQRSNNAADPGTKKNANSPAEKDLFSVQSQKFLNSYENKVYQSPWWYFLKIEIAFGIAALLGWLKGFLYWPQDTINSTAPLLDVIPRTNAGFDLFEFEPVFYAVLLVPLVFRLIIPKPWATIEGTKLKISGKRIIELNEIWKISRNGYRICFHYYPHAPSGDGSRVETISGWRCLGQLNELEMTLRGMLLKAKKMTGNHISIGETYLEFPPLFAFVAKCYHSVSRIFNSEENEEFPDRRRIWEIVHVWGGAVLLGLFLFHQDIAPSLSSMFILFLQAAAVFVGLRILSMVARFIQILAPVLVLIAGLIFIGGAIWFGSFDKAEKWFRNLVNFESSSKSGKIKSYGKIDQFIIDNPLYAPLLEGKIPAVGPPVTDARIRFDNGRFSVSYNSPGFVGKGRFDVGLDTRLNDIVLTLGAPDFLVHDHEESEQILYYLEWGTRFHFNENRLKHLIVLPPGFIVVEPTGSSNYPGKEYKTMTWRNTPGWFFDEIPLYFSDVKASLLQVLTYRHHLPDLYMIPEPGFYTFSPCRHPEYSECGMIVFENTETTGQMYIKVIF